VEILQKSQRLGDDDRPDRNETILYYIEVGNIQQQVPTVRYQYASGPIKCQFNCLIIFLYSIPFAANNNEGKNSHCQVYN